MVTETAMVTVTNYGGPSPSPVAEVGNSPVASTVNAPAASPETTAAPSSEVSSSSSAPSYSAPSPLSVVAAQVSAVSTLASSAAPSSSSSSAAGSSVTASPAYSAGSGSSDVSSGSETATVSDSHLCGSWATGEPIVHFHNPTSEQADYHYQTNLAGDNGAPESSNLPFATSGDIVVPPNTVYVWCPGTHWAGAIGHRGLNNGTRHELNFETPDTTWYNSDLEYGISNSMMKPAVVGDYLDDKNTITAMVGTMDYLTTLNDAWSIYNGSIPALDLSPTKEQLLSTKYLYGNADGSLTFATTDEEIRESTSIHVAAFFQVNLLAYVTHGSWLGVDQTKVDALANHAVRTVSGNQEFHIHSK